MNWRNLAAWIYKDAALDLPKIRRYDIKTVYVDPRSENARSVIQQGIESNLAMGIYAVANWWPNSSPVDFVAHVSDYIGALIPQSYPLPTQEKGAPVMLDLEAVSKSWTRDVLIEYRRVRKVRETAYTNEPFKDGSVVPIPDLVAGSFHWYPQLYYGDMHPADPAAVLLEVGRWGFPADRLHPFYDGARLPGDHRDGCVFVLERLP